MNEEHLLLTEDKIDSPFCSINVLLKLREKMVYQTFIHLEMVGEY